MKTESRRRGWRIAGVVALLLITVAAIFIVRLRQRLPPGMMKDVRAGIAARHIADPDARLAKYLEGRYGSMDDPANRRKVFLDFFDVEHIKALQLLVRHSPEEHRKESILAMSRWVEQYRQSLTPQERADLRQQFSGDQGRAMLHQATAQYNSQGVEYRGQTAPVISQLLKTLNSVQNP
ncbi:MAG TPA: hypothetical protein VFW05_04090 [Verrucomicrobiae bacterium]|nr:hypothetical protein [Verrucomicrobiae bacterium]